MKLAKCIDHTLLKADARPADLAKLCREAREHGFASVCVNPCWVSKCAKLLRGSGVKVCTVIGFPLGSTSSYAKLAEALQAIEDGARELDVVVNQGFLKSDAYSCYYDLAPLVAECRKAKRGLVLKLILECCNLEKYEIEFGCDLAMKAGFDFVKTSTGFGSGGATAEDVALMRKAVGKKLGVKASGGVRTKEAALAMIKAGANRIGTSAGVAICGGA